MNRMGWMTSPWFAPVLILAAMAIAAASYLPARAIIKDKEERLSSAQETLARLNGQIEIGRYAISSSSRGGSPFAADFLSGANESLVVAGLQSRLRDTAIQNNVELNSSNALPPRTEEGVTYVGLHLIMRGEIKDIQRVLHTVETGKPLLFVSRAAMRMDTWPITSNDPERNGRPALVAELDVFGATLPAGVAEAAPPAASDAGSPRPAVPAVSTTPRSGRR